MLKTSINKKISKYGHICIEQIYIMTSLFLRNIREYLVLQEIWTSKRSLPRLILKIVFWRIKSAIHSKFPKLKNTLTSVWWNSSWRKWYNKIWITAQIMWKSYRDLPHLTIERPLPQHLHGKRRGLDGIWSYLMGKFT